MIRSELIDKVAAAFPHLHLRDVERAVATIFEEIVEAMARGQRVELKGFGVFTVKKRNARVGRNPRTGESVRVEEKHVPFFKTGKALRTRLDGSVDSSESGYYPGPPVRDKPMTGSGRASSTTPQTNPTDHTHEEEFVTRRVFFGTNRKKIDGKVSHSSYGSQRGEKLLVGYSEVSIPKDRFPGTITRPKYLKFWKIPLPFKEQENVSKHFTERKTVELTEEEFLSEVTKAEHEFAAGSAAIVYVHGFNNTFQHAVFRAAQLGEDLKFDGLVFAFSWPARGGVANYITDMDSARLAVLHLDRFLHLIGQNSGLSTIHLIVHSMGNALLSQLMERSGTLLEKRTGKSIDQLVLAAPDVDRAVFEEVADYFKWHARNVTLYASSKDVALNVSEGVRAAYPRAGDVPDGVPLIIDGVDTMDVSAVETGLFGLKHNTYGESDRVINDVLARIKGFELPPHKRLTDVERVNVPSVGHFFRFKPIKR